MAGKKFNPGAPYGEVSGEHGARYFQDGSYFDAQGNEIVSAAPAKAAKAKPAPADIDKDILG